MPRVSHGGWALTKWVLEWVLESGKRCSSTPASPPCRRGDTALVFTGRGELEVGDRSRGQAWEGVQRENEAGRIEADLLLQL